MTERALSREQMVSIYQMHGRAEFERNVDKAMESVAANPVYEWPCLNLRIAGRPAVREYYSRVINKAIKAHVLSQRTLATGDGVLTAEYVLNITRPSDAPIRAGLVCVVTFDDGKIQAERVYSHPTYTELLRGAIGADFESVPGVSQIDYGKIVAEECRNLGW
jgi:ketosteroid isomerase-like protein